ncbi:MAG: DUF559 domain-containing protein [Actinomycetota bacterium]
MYDGVLTRRTALIDLSPTALNRLIRTGALLPAFRGVLISSPTSGGRADPMLLRRAGLAYADIPHSSTELPAYLCCASAAAEWDLPVPSLPDVFVGVPRTRVVAKQPGLHVHRHDIQEDQVAIRNGVRLVNRHCALVQAFTVLETDDRRQLVIRSVQRGLVSADLAVAATTAATRHRKEFLELIALTRAGSHSELEIKALSRVLARYGIAELFQQQYADALPSQHAPMDFAVVAFRLNLETDGSRYHTDPEQRRWDVRRDLDLKRLRWTVIRCQYENVVDEPERVAAAVLSELLQRGWQGRPTTAAGRLLLATLRE